MRITFECIALVKACKICILFRIHSPVRRWSSERRSRASWVHQHLIDIYTRLLDLSCIQCDPSPLDSLYLCTRFLSRLRKFRISCHWLHQLLTFDRELMIFHCHRQRERTLLHENEIDFWLRPSLASRSRNCEQCSFRLEQSGNVCCVAEVKNELHPTYIYFACIRHLKFEIASARYFFSRFCFALGALWFMIRVDFLRVNEKSTTWEEKKTSKNNNKSKSRQFEQQQRRNTEKYRIGELIMNLLITLFQPLVFMLLLLLLLFFSVSTCFTVQESKHQWLSVIFNISFVSLPFWVVCGVAVAVVCRHIICIDRNFGAC